MTLQTQTISNAVLSEVVSYFKQVEYQFEPKAVESLKAKAERALNTGAGKVAAFMALGIIYDYEKNFKKASLYFKSANMEMPNNEVVVKNYAGHLNSFFLFSESVDTLVKFIDKNKTKNFHNVYALALDYALYSGQYKKIVDRLSENIIYCDDNNKETYILKTNYATHAMKLDIENKRTDDMNIDAIKLIGSFVERNGHNVMDVSSRILSDEYDTWISYKVSIDTKDRSIVRKLNNKLCDWLADHDSGYYLFSNGVSFRLGVINNGN